MNKCIFLGRLVADVDERVSQGANPLTVGRFRLAVNRRFKHDGDPDADFLNMVAFGKAAENIGKYFKKGSLILVETHVQTSNYTDKNNIKVYRTDFIVDAFDFVESKKKDEEPAPAGDGFVSADEYPEDLPFA